MSEKNWDLLIKTAEYILDHPTEWHQGHWVSSCGTTACFAGWAAKLSDLKFVTRTYGEDLKPVWTGEVINKAGYVEEIRSAAADLLSLEDYWNDYDGDYDESSEASRLFNGSNDINDILQLLREWAAEDDVEIPERLKKNYATLWDEDWNRTGFQAVSS